MKQIVITVAPSGETRLETQGFTGAACREASAPLIAALGLVTSDHPTAEAYAKAPLTEQVEQLQPPTTDN